MAGAKMEYFLVWISFLIPRSESLTQPLIDNSIILDILDLLNSTIFANSANLQPITAHILRGLFFILHLPLLIHKKKTFLD